MHREKGREGERTTEREREWCGIGKESIAGSINVEYYVNIS